MKPVIYKISAIVLVLFMVACKPDNKAKLTNLKKQHEKISAEIKKLEEEIAKADTSIKVEKLHLVAILEMKADTFKHFIEVQGRLDGEGNVDVHAEAMGVIDAVTVKNGQQVAKGQVLAHINDAAYREQLKGLETQYQFVKETFEKQERLWNQKIGSEMQYLQIKSQKEGLESQLAATRKQLDMMAIKAPISGTVEDVIAKLGQTASPAYPCFRIMNFSSVKVIADVAEAYSEKINVGDKVDVFFPDLGQEVSASISAASRYINPMNRTFQVEVRLNAGKDGYKANMVAVLKIVDYEATDAMVLPVNYIQTDPQGSYVYIIDENTGKKIAKKAYIKQGQSYNGMIELSEGLKAGDKVISAGYLDLEEGDAVKL